LGKCAFCCWLIFKHNINLSIKISFKRDDVRGEWRRLHNEELRDIYYSPNICRVMKSRIMRWVGHVARIDDRRGACRILVVKPEVKGPFGITRPRWEYKIKINFKEVS
jgi:hypothetical protein